MLTPGFKSLGNFTITTAGMQVSDAVDDLEGVLALCAQLRFAYGSGGSAVKVYIQTSTDQGNTWTDIACAAFATATATRTFNFSALTPKTTPIVPTDGALADDTAIDGILGDIFRVKVISTGTYGSTTLSASAIVR